MAAVVVLGVGLAAVVLCRGGGKPVETEMGEPAAKDVREYLQAASGITVPSEGVAPVAAEPFAEPPLPGLDREKPAKILEAIAPRATPFIITDRGGSPVSGARVRVGDAVSGRTGAEGRTSLVLPPSAGSVFAGAAGFEIKEVPLPAPLPEEITIALGPANRLTLEVRNPDGTIPAPGLVVALEYGRGRMPDAPEKFGDFADVRGTTAFSGHGTMVSSSGGAGIGRGGAIEERPERDPWARKARGGTGPMSKPREVSHGDLYALDAEGRWTLSSFIPGDEFRLQLRDRYAYVIREEKVSVAAADDRVLRWRVPRPPRDLAGRVVDERGGPIGGATVGHGHELTTEEVQTDAEGAFLLPGVHAPAPVMWIRAAGHVGRVLEGASVLDAREFVLEEARRVELEIVDSRGEPVDAQVRFHTADGGLFHAGFDRESGRYVLEAVPRRAGMVIVKKGALTAETPLGAADLHLRFAPGR